MTRDEFMDAFRNNDNLCEELSDDDCREVFAGILKGESDLTGELFEQVCSNYGVNFEVIARAYLNIQNTSNTLNRIQQSINNQIINQDLEKIAVLIDEYRNEPLHSGDWQPKENPDISKGEYGYKDQQKESLAKIVKLIKRLPHD